MGACVVFGGTKGIGAAIAKRLFNGGLNVAIVSRNPKNVSEGLENFDRANGAEIIGLSCDVTNEEQVTATLNEVSRTLGPVSVLVNSAGVTQNQLLLKTQADDIRHCLDVNLIGSMTTCKACLRGMIQQRAGCIVNIGSIVGSKGNAGQCAYSASKAGVEGFTKSLAKEVAARGIRVNCVNPGYIKTDMTAGLDKTKQLLGQIPLGRMGEPEEVADMVWFLINATYITGQTLFVDGGLHINS